MPIWVAAGTMKQGVNVHVVTGCYIAGTQNEVIGQHTKNMFSEKPGWQLDSVNAYKVGDDMVLMAATEILRSQRNAEGSDGDR